MLQFLSCGTLFLLASDAPPNVLRNSVHLRLSTYIRASASASILQGYFQNISILTDLTSFGFTHYIFIFKQPGKIILAPQKTKIQRVSLIAALNTAVAMGYPADAFFLFHNSGMTGGVKKGENVK
jgi:hypothetical protein